MRSTPSVLILFLALALPCLHASIAPATAQVAPVGDEFKVNGSDGVFHSSPVATVLPSGEFIVVWHGVSDQLGNSDSDIIAQRLDRRGIRQGSEFMINTWTSGLQSGAVVASNISGAGVVVWEGSGVGNLDDGSLFGRVFDTAGAPVGGEFQVNAGTRDLQFRPEVDMDPSGRFVVVWTTTSGNWSVLGRRFHSTGLPDGTEFRINTHTPEFQREPDVAMDAAGSFVVVWQSDGGQDGYRGGIFGRRYDSAGAAVGGEFLVNAQTMWSQERPAIDMTPSGDFVVVWDGLDPGGSYTSIHGRTFDGAGNPLGPEFREPVAPSVVGIIPDVSMKDSGEFTITWRGRDGHGEGAFARAFDGQGFPLGDTFLVNTYTVGDQRLATIGANGDGRSVVVWVSQFRPGIFARILDRPTLHITQPRDGDPVDCSAPRLRRPTFRWEPAHYEEFRVQVGSDPEFRGAMRGTAASGWAPGSSWTPPRGQWRKACRAGLAGGVFDAKLYLRVIGRDLDLPENDPGYERSTDVFVLPIGIDLFNPPMDPSDLEIDGRRNISPPGRGGGS